MPPSVSAHHPLRVLNPLSFRDPEAEQQFQKHYTAPRPVIDHVLAAGAVLAVLSTALHPLLAAVLCYIPGISAGCAAAVDEPAAEITSGDHLLRTAVTLTPTLLSTLLPSGSHYITVRHVLHAVGRVLFTLTLLTGEYIRSTAVWQHRTFILHLLAALSRCPLHMYWCGALATWLAASAVDLGGIPADCAQSIVCLFRSLQDSAATFVAAATLHPVLQASKVAAVLSSSSSLSHLADAILPGLLTMYLERRARRAWLAQQQQQQDEQPSSNAACTSKGHCSVAPAAIAVIGPYTTAGGSKVTMTNVAAAKKRLETTPAAAAAAAAATPQQDTHTPRRQLGYVSPLRREIYAFKFNHPPDAGTEEYHLLQQKLIAAMQAQFSISNNGSSTGIGNVTSVAKCIGVKGCWQLVMDVVSTKTAAAAAADSALQQQQLDTLMQSVLQDLPGWNIVAWQELQATAAAAASVVSETITDATTVAAAALAAADVYPSPIAIRHTMSSSTAATGAQSTPASSSSAAAAATAVKLYVPSVLVHQLLAAGNDSLRVVVAQQRDSRVLLDQTWSLDALQTAAVAASSGHDGVEVELCVPQISAATHLLTPAAIAAAAAEITEKDCDAYTLLVMKVDGSTAAGATLASAVGQLGTAQMSHDTAAAGFTVGGPVLVQLPLLLLPAAAQRELQELFTAVVDKGQQPSKAYQMLLPLLQDWALLVLPHEQTSSSSNEGVSAVVQFQMSLACDALLSYFNRANKLQCYKLVSEQKERIQQWQRQQQEQAAPQGSDSDHEDPPGRAAAGGAAAPECEKDSSGSRSGAGGSSSAGGAAAGGSGGEGPRVTKRSVCAGFPSIAIRQAYNIYKSTALKRHDGIVAQFYLFGMFVALLRAVTFMGTSPAAAAAAATAAAAVAAPIAADAAAAVSAAVAPDANAEVASILFKAVILLLCATPHVLLWCAAQCCGAKPGLGQDQQSQDGLMTSKKLSLSSLVHWRGTLFTCSTLMMVFLLQLFVRLGGFWGSAMVLAIQRSHASTLPLVMYNQVVQPSLFRSGPFTMVACTAVETLWADSLHPGPHFYWVHNMWLAGLLMLVGVLVSCAWERSMQRSFVAQRSNTVSAW